jgi:hypothetical protein
VPTSYSSTTWLSVRMQERGFTDIVVLAKLDAVLVSSSGEGFTTEASLAMLRPEEFHLEYLQSVGITARGTAGQLVALHRELHAQYTAASSPTPSTNSATDAATLTPDEKARLLETQNTVQSLTAEVTKLRAATAASSQQQSGGRDGGKGGLMQKQAQCNVVNPRTGQPYTMDELAAGQNRHESLLEHVGNSAEEALSTAVRVAELAAPDALPRSSDKAVHDPAAKEALFGKGADR